MPELYGPEPSPYQSGKTPLREGDIDRYGGFNTKSRVGDSLEGHEVIQNAYLKAIGEIEERGVGEISRGNPSLAVSEELHGRIDAAQRALGLWDRANLARLSDQEIINKNIQALEIAGVEPTQVEIIRREATRYAAEQLGP
jgi:hypothetical protein